MVTTCLKNINPPHAFVRIYGKKTNNGGLSLYLNYTLNKKRVQRCMRLYVDPDTDKRGKVNKLIRMENLKVLHRASERRNELEKNILERNSDVNNDFPRVKLIDYLDDFIEESKLSRKSDSYARVLECLSFHLKQFLGKKVEKIALEDVTPEFCRDFIHYFKEAKTNKNKKLSPTSSEHYFSFFKVMLDNAVRDDLLWSNPILKLKKYELIKSVYNPQEALSNSELKQLKASRDPDSIVQTAFLFSCYTGLRVSDIRLLSWENISFSPEKVEMNIIMKKTDKALRLKLCKEAINYLPDPIKQTGLVFDLPGRTLISKQLYKWVKDAKIKKKVVFHTARHTFGTMLSEKGVGIEVIQKLMGHTSINTTSIYIDVSDKAKDAAINLL